METDDLMNVEGIFEFSVGQHVLVYFDGMLYNANCLKRRITDIGALEYYVHYVGFKTRYDEWVSEDDVLEVNLINLEHKSRLESNRKSCRKRVKKSQDPWTPKAAPSKPAEDGLPRKRGRPKKKLKPSAKPVVEEKSILDVQNEEISVVQNKAISDVQNGEISVVQNEEISVVQNEEITVVQNEEISVVQNEEISVVQNEENSVVQNEEISVVQGIVVPAEEDEAAVQALANIVLNIIPRSMILADKLRALRIPTILKDTLYLDHAMHQSFNMLLKFSEDNFVAEVLHMFIKSSYFSEVDNHKKYSMVFPVTLMKYFNASVHTHLTYRIEQIHSLRNKGMAYFQQRIHYQPNINYIFKDQLYPKRIWCYLYGPMYLLRLLEHLPMILSSNSWHPEYDSDTFVQHIEQLFRFLANNFESFFRINDFIAAEDFPFSLIY